MKVECAWCGDTFDRDLSALKKTASRGMRHTCNQRCRAALGAATRQGVGATMVLSQCPVCGGAVSSELRRYKEALRRGSPKFCSRSCACHYRHGKRYDGEVIEPRVIENMKVGK